MRKFLSKLSHRKSSTPKNSNPHSATGKMSNGRYIEFWRTKSFDDHLSELQQNPEDFQPAVMEYSALFYDQLHVLDHMNLLREEVLEIGDDALRLALEYVKQEWRWLGVKIISDVGNAGFSDITREGEESDENRSDAERMGMSWVINTSDVGITELKEDFILNGARLRCEYKASLYRYLRANSDILNFEIIGGVDDQVTADGEGAMPVLPPFPDFSNAMGGREGFFLKFTGNTQTNRTPEERLSRFLLMTAMYFPHM